MLLLALLLSAASPQFDTIVAPRWTQDGTALVYEGDILVAENEDGSRPRELAPAYAFDVVAAPSGEVQRVFRKAKNPTGPDSTDARGESLWASAQEADAFGAWLRQHPVLAPPASQQIRFDPGQKRSRPVPLRVGSRTVPLIEESGARETQRLLAGEAQLFAGAPAPKGDFTRASEVSLSASPDGARVAALWTLEYAREAGNTANVIARSQLAVLTERGIGGLDLLDAGAGVSADAVARKLTEAGFRVVHRGKAQKQRPESAVYFTDGFEADAREAARLVGAKVVEKATWNTPFAITVAAAR
jgi:hypothetical protein